VRGKPVLLVGTGEAADAKARLIAAAGGIVVRRPDPAVRLAFVALDDVEDATRVAAGLRATGLLVNVVDKPALCDFSVPAIVDRAPVLVAVSSGGASASLSKALRERLEAWLPAGLGRLAQAILAARTTVAVSHPAVAARRLLWDGALAAGGPLDPLADHPDPVAAIAALGTAMVAAARLDTVVLTSADPDDLTLRQLRLLAQADTVYHDANVPQSLLDRARRDAARVAAAPPGSLPAGRSVYLARR